jgi:hypothetical protein
MQFSDLIGQEILILPPNAQEGSQKIRAVKLVGVEAGGLWIESQEVTNALLRVVGSATSPQTPVLFLPYHEIGGVLVSVEQTALDEKAFGV